jgi:phosphatidylserine decarboxylase
VPRLFARNERLVCLFDTAAGPMAMILVGALFVACIETVWGGVVTPPAGHRIRIQDFDARGDESVVLARGAEMGRFNMGSTVILLFGDQLASWAESLAAEQPVQLGQAIGQWTPIEDQTP